MRKQGYVMKNILRLASIYSAALLSISIAFSQTPAPSLDSEQSAFLTLINTYRAQNGVGPLQVSVALEQSSQWMSNDMAINNYFSHTDSLGRDPFTRMGAFSYTYYPWGENIAAGYSDAYSTFHQWLTACDPDGYGNCTYAHQHNMLNSGFVAIGIGRAYSPNSSYRWYWTTDFGGYLDQTIASAPITPVTHTPVISVFTANPSTLTMGQSAPLLWTVAGATTVIIDNGVGDVSNLTSKVVAPLQTTTYTLTAINSGVTATAQVTLTVNPLFIIQPPTTPAIVSSIAKNATEVDLAWTPSTSTVGVGGYQIIRNGSVLISVPGSVTSYADTSVSANTLYSYAVQSYDGFGKYSTASNTIQVITPAVAFKISPPPALTTASCPGPATGAFTGCYYNTTDLSGNPALVRTDSSINFDWGAGSPGAAVTALNFSARWQGIFSFEEGNYIFYITMSDGMRMYIDGNPVMYRWRDQPANAYRVLQSIGQGNHLITIEYYEHTGTAAAMLSWQKN